MGYIGNFPTAVPLSNSDLINSSITVNGTEISLGGSETITTGKVLQVQNRFQNNDESTSSTSPVASVFSHTITPSATSSKILIQVNGGRASFGGGEAEGTYWLYHSIGGGGFSEIVRGKQSDNNISGGFSKTTFSFSYLHSANTTSTVEYKIYYRTNANTYYLNSASSSVMFTLMEIGA